MVIRGLIFDIRRFTVHDGPGIRTTVFFKGCPLTCWWCHNPESQDFKSERSIKNLVLSGTKFQHSETTGNFMTVDEVMAEVQKDEIFYEESGGGVTFSGGEPMMQEPFLHALLQASKTLGWHTAVDTSGYATHKAMEHTAPLVDLFLYDVKLMNDELHRKYTGVSNKPILENLEFLYRSGKNITLRFPVIPGITDTYDNIQQIKTLIIRLQSQRPVPMAHGSPLSIHLLPYHTIARDKYRRFCKTNQLEGVHDLKQEALAGLKQEFEEMGLTVKIGG